MRRAAARRIDVRRSRAARVGVAVLLALATLGVATGAAAHSGGLDSNGGHYCRDAGYEAGTCSPLGSYHCHDVGCVDHDGATGNGGGDGDGDSGGDRDSGAGPSEPTWDVYQPAPSGVTGETMRARRMFGLLTQARERGGYWYDRDEFPHWSDLNGDGCDTRAAVLISESLTSLQRTADCTVTSGAWFSVYDGQQWTNPSDVDVDHLVALREAWVSGAHSWSRTDRRAFANDLRFRPSLRAVTDNVNASKSDRDPAEWLPARARCEYAANWVQVKYRWRLKANLAERQVLAGILDGDCGARRIAIPIRGR